LDSALRAGTYPPDRIWDAALWTGTPPPNGVLEHLRHAGELISNQVTTPYATANEEREVLVQTASTAPAAKEDDENDNDNESTEFALFEMDPDEPPFPVSGVGVEKMAPALSTERPGMIGSARMPLKTTAMSTDAVSIISGAVALPAGQSNIVVSLREFLVPYSLHLEVYIDALMLYGYEDTGVLREAEDEDLKEAFLECKVKKPHQRVIMKAVMDLKFASTA
jgi:hypothetical protein